jgi:hypothetical protein
VNLFIVDLKFEFMNKKYYSAFYFGFGFGFPDLIIVRYFGLSAVFWLPRDRDM